MTQTFKHFFTGTAAIRRSSTIVTGGKRGTSGASDVTILTTPLTTVTNDEVRRQVAVPILNTPMEIRQAFAGSSGHVDVRKGDIYVLGSRLFPIRSVERWPLQDPNEELLRLIIEVVDK